jgi:penicillin-binding protein 1A
MDEFRIISRQNGRSIAALLPSLPTRLLSLAISFPLLTLACALYAFRLCGIRRDFLICKRLLSKGVMIPASFVDLLIISEDHRNRWHFGIDPLSIARVLVKQCYSKGVGGASTIEQQFTRIALGRFEKTLSRKFREQIVATLLVCTTEREVIAKKYLEIAYLGTGKIGVISFESVFGCALRDFSLDQVVGIVARLKYPEPRVLTPKWQRRFDKRCLYIKRKVEKACRYYRKGIKGRG